MVSQMDTQFWNSLDSLKLKHSLDSIKHKRRRHYLHKEIWGRIVLGKGRMLVQMAKK